MGVGGKFWDLLKPYARAEGFDFLRNKRVAVDLSFWIVQHETAVKDRARNPHLRLTFFRTIKLFSKFGAFPVFIVDGVPSPLKSQARIMRFFHSCGFEIPSLPATKLGVSVERNHKFSKCVQECVELLELFGMPVLKAKGEAEALCAQLNANGFVAACITSDSDAFLYGAKCVVKCFRTNSKEPFECYNMSDIEAGLGLKRKHLIALSLLVGNDHDLKGVQGIGLEGALRFIKSFSEDDVLSRLCEIGNGSGSQLYGSIKSSVIYIDIEESLTTTKEPHCSFCGHPGSKRAHLKFSCIYCGTSVDENCIKKPEGFKCDCLSCEMNQKQKEENKLYNWQKSICHKIEMEPNFPNDKLLEMYLCNSHGNFSEDDGPCIEWRRPKLDMLLDFLTIHQHWEPSYIRLQMLPMMSTIFFRDMAAYPEQRLLLGQYELDSVQRVKIRYGYQVFVVKWKHLVECIVNRNPCKEFGLQQEDAKDVDLLDESDDPMIHVQDGFLLTDENMDLVSTAFPEKVDSFWQEQEKKEMKRKSFSSPRSEAKKGKSASPNSKGTQLNMTDFYRSTKVLSQSKFREELAKHFDDQKDGTSVVKRKGSSSNLSKSVRRRLLFD